MFKGRLDSYQEEAEVIDDSRLVGMGSRHSTPFHPIFRFQQKVERGTRFDWIAFSTQGGARSRQPRWIIAPIVGRSYDPL